MNYIDFIKESNPRSIAYLICGIAGLDIDNISDEAIDKIVAFLESEVKEGE